VGGRILATCRGTTIRYFPHIYPRDSAARSPSPSSVSKRLSAPSSVPAGFTRVKTAYAEKEKPPRRIPSRAFSIGTEPRGCQA